MGGLEVLVVILVAIFSSITAPLILARRTEKMHREDRLADYQREDEKARLLKADQLALAAATQKTAADLAESQRVIAAHAAEAARILLMTQQDSIARTDEVAQVAATQADRSNEKLDEINAQAKLIHTLVNSDMTAARQSELDSTRAIVVVLRRVIGLASRTPNLEPDPDDVTALDTAENRVKELEAILADRLERMRIVEAGHLDDPPHHLKDNS